MYQPFCICAIKDLLSQDMCEQAICPFPGVWIQSTIKVIFANCFWIYNVSNTFHTLQPLKGLQKYSPGHALSTSRGTNHHQTMIYLCDLIQLKNL